mgnify:FL=1
MSTIAHVFLLSDATGETAEKMVMAALTQFKDKPSRVRRFSNVRNKTHVYEAIDEALKQQGLVVFTIVNRDLAKLVQDECSSLGLPCIDLITPLLMRLGEFLGISPQETPGLLHGISEEYFRRIEAVEFAVKHDDGQEVRNLHQADIILAGVSRTSKTPLSIFLAHRGWKVANIPLVNGIEPPKELLEATPSKVAGLLIDTDRLTERRVARLRHLGQDPRSAYADIEQIEEEISWTRRLFRQHRWAMINVSDKAVEETANEILVRLKLK